ncbi:MULTISPECIES: DUF1488 domain-containing protein [Vibrio]|uniref:DUF1488 domain-containing protein n=1 Tax=Vibrio TaxID=662 RepID=UPI0001B94FA9|nr:MULTISPECIES: DUF1488 domain-containing protein [Vibrio]EEX35273.1 hypothetical protein VIC_000397 [Vibrio coralliilyticus ATCC BAA-450]MCM5510651.1 DUF1488 domain-containing protein [Vibrio sp. SCSIO 43169]MDE3900377.1 DUF1488 domain-containing protein [Vibrio sp. CC007]NRF17073.1 DUF1488 domain-containing protein [Vibrio coralliilyticus]QFT34884.1 hypothetical protein FIU99_00305 [Vibrio sp. THAF64]
MNQSILFPDMQHWDDHLQAIVFPAQQSGALIECVVTLNQLEVLAGQKLQGAEQALVCFSQHRFDLEELAEELIEDEAFNQSGQVEVIC